MVVGQFDYYNFTSPQTPKGAIPFAPHKGLGDATLRMDPLREKPL